MFEVGQITGYPLLMPLAGFGTLVLMVLGVYFLLRRFARKELERLISKITKK